MNSVVRSTRRELLITTTFVVLAIAGQAVHATEPSAASGFYVDVGLAGLLFDTDGSINVAGSHLPDSNLHASNNVTLGLGIGYFVTPNVSLLAVLGVPPTTTLTGQGSLSGLTLGKVAYGPSMLVANYHFRQFGAFQPFLGAGITYTVVFGTQDNAISNLKVNNSIGAVLRTGFDVMFSDRWGAFLSISKAFVATNASGNAAIPTLDGAPVSAHVNFNPLVLFSGITCRF
ncbi:MAG TPA: OmpW family outer membrane protein [Acetobacteraceae bacterium]